MCLRAAFVFLIGKPAFLVMHEETRLTSVSERRPVVNPNQGFMRQLVALERRELGITSVDPKWYEDDWGTRNCNIRKKAAMTHDALSGFGNLDLMRQVQREKQQQQHAESRQH
jgi:hypothetical protein